MEAGTSALNGLKAANLTDDTDFTIVIGQHEWRVHSKTISRASRFLEVACSGGFEVSFTTQCASIREPDILWESFTKRVELHDDNPWDIARLIQFCYLGTYDAQITQQGERKPLTVLELMSKANGLESESRRSEELRSTADVHSSMWEIATKYNSTSLRKYVAYEWVFDLERSARSGSNKNDLAEALVTICDRTIGFLHEMGDIEDRLIEVLCAIKFSGYSPTTQYATSVLSGHPDKRLSAPNDASTSLRTLQSRMISYVSRGGTFAVKIAYAMENMTSKSLQRSRWPNRQLKNLKIGRITHFASWQLDV